MKLLTSLLLLLSLALTSGCAWWGKNYDPTKGWSAAKLYAEAKDNLENGNYAEAIDLFETLEARYPFGRFAQQAQLEAAYAYFKHEEPDAAIAAADRFIKLHPQNPNVDYAYYLKGLANFDRGRNFLSSVVRRNPAYTDPSPLMRAFEDFSFIVNNYPDSRYARDARQRMVFLRNELAEHEILIAHYYLQRGAFVAAANRGKYVLENFQGSAAVPDALVVMIKAYKKLGLTQLAEDSSRILEVNYPDKLADLKRQEKGFFRRFF